MTPRKCARLGCEQFTERMYKVIDDLIVPLCDFHAGHIAQEAVTPWGYV